MGKTARPCQTLSLRLLSTMSLFSLKCTVPIGPNGVQQPDLCQTLSLRLLNTMSLFSMKCTVPIGPNGENSQTMPNAFSPAPEHDEPILTEMHCSHGPNVVQQPDLCQTLSLRLLSTMSLFSLKCTVPIGPNGVEQPDLCQTLSLRLLSTMSLFSLKCTVPIGPNGVQQQDLCQTLSLRLLITVSLFSLK